MSTLKLFSLPQHPRFTPFVSTNVSYHLQRHTFSSGFVTAMFKVYYHKRNKWLNHPLPYRRSSNCKDQSPWEANSHSETFSPFMELEASSSCNQKPTTGPYARPQEYGPHSDVIFMWDPFWYYSFKKRENFYRSSLYKKLALKNYWKHTMRTLHEVNLII
jgi:hypothetical protein